MKDNKILSRYEANLGSFLTEKDQDILLTKTIGVIGCGGQGGYILDFFSRLGVKKIIFCDGDYYDETNLNRQNFSSAATIGVNKAEEILLNLQDINNTIEYNCISFFFNEENSSFFEECDIIFVCAELNKDLENIVKSFKKPIVDAANWSYGAAISIFTPEYYNYYINSIHVNNAIRRISQTAFSCALTAAIATNEVVKFLLNKPVECVGRILIYDVSLGYTFIKDYN